MHVNSILPLPTSRRADLEPPKRLGWVGVRVGVRARVRARVRVRVRVRVRSGVGLVWAPQPSFRADLHRGGRYT